MSLLRQTCTIKTQSKSRSTGGFAQRDLNTETSGVPCNWQPTQSSKEIENYLQRGGVGGTLFYDAAYTIDSDDRVEVVGETWEVAGPAAQAAGANTKWVSLFRKDP